jgi:hypothetical protein
MKKRHEADQNAPPKSIVPFDQADDTPIPSSKLATTVLFQISRLNRFQLSPTGC